MKDGTIRSLALVGLTLGLLALCALLALPFLPALAWGTAFTIIAWPMQVWLRRRFANANWAALLTTLAVLIVIVVPGIFMAYQLLSEVNSNAERLKSESVGNTVREKMSEVPALHGTVGWLDRLNIDVDLQVREMIGKQAQNAASVVQGSIWAILQFVLVLFLLYHFLKDGPAWRDRVRAMLPMSRADCDRVFASVAAAVHANIYATTFTSLINGVTGGLLFWALGLPSPILWGVVIFLVSVIPILGTFLVWVPACIYLFITNQWTGAFALMAWGIGTAIAVDSLLYAQLAGNRMRLHQVPAILGFLGGIVLFGPAGMILGPTILAVTGAVLDVWRRRDESAAASETIAGTTRAAAESGLLTASSPRVFQSSPS